MTLPVDYGEDLFNDGDLSPVDRIVSGFEALAQALLRRLDTPPEFIDDEDGTYGYDITLLLSDAMTASDISAIASRVEHEFVQDERVVSATVIGKISQAARSVRLTCKIVPRDGGPFTFVLAISDVAKTLESVSEAA